MRSYPLSIVVLVCILVLVIVKGCGCSESHPSVNHRAVIEKKISLRNDSATVVVTIPPKQFFVRGKANRRSGVQTVGRSVHPERLNVQTPEPQQVCLDTIGFFSPNDTTQIHPDTVSACYDEAKQEFDFSLHTSLRKRLEIIRFLARDSVTSTKDSVTIFLPPDNNTVLIAGAAGLVLGILIGVMLTH